MPGLQAPQGELATIAISRESTFGVFPGSPSWIFHAFTQHNPTVSTSPVPRAPRGSIAAPIPGTGGRTVAMSLDVEPDEDTISQLLAFTLGAQTTPSATLFTSTLNGLLNSGATAAVLTSTNFIYAGQSLIIDVGGSHPETVTVTGITNTNAISFTPATAFSHASGATCTVTGTGGSKMSTLKMVTPLPSFTMQVSRPGGTSTDYLGSCIDQLQLSLSNKGALKTKFSLSAQQVVNDASPVTPTMSVLNPYIAEQQFTAAQIGGEVPSILSAASLEEWTLSINNNFNKSNFAIGAGNTVRSFLEQMRKVTGSMKLMFETNVQYNNCNAALNGGNLPPITMLLPLVGTDSSGSAPYAVGIWLPNVFLSKSAIADDTSKPTELTVNFECGESTPGANDTTTVTIVGKLGTSAY
jgi:hypothetical protein